MARRHGYRPSSALKSATQREGRKAAFVTHTVTFVILESASSMKKALYESTFCRGCSQEILKQRLSLTLVLQLDTLRIGTASPAAESLFLFRLQVQGEIGIHPISPLIFNNSISFTRPLTPLIVASTVHFFSSHGKQTEFFMISFCEKAQWFATCSRKCRQNVRIYHTAYDSKLLFWTFFFNCGIIRNNTKLFFRTRLDIQKPYI